MGEKTEKPTPKKLRDARKKGQVGQSQDVPKLLIVAALLEVVLAMVETGMGNMQDLVATPLGQLDQPFEYALQAVVVQCLTIAVSMIAMALGLAVIMRLLGSWLQFGFLFAPEALKIDFNKLNPFPQLKNMFSGKKLFELLNSLTKAIILAIILSLLLPPALQTLAKLPLTDLDTAWHAIALLFVKIERTCLLVLLVLAVLDFGMQKYFHLKSLKMSKDDIKQEYKSTEGDPHTKGYRRSLARELATSGGPARGSRPKPELEEADALVVNPTHFAVGLYYRPETTPLPRIVCKGVDEDALALIEQAKEKGIPIIRFIWLARTLHRERAGGYIPRETLRHVAKIYQVIRELDDDAMDDGILHIPDLEIL
ncbi:type III secretion system export apparatus subunit SctU [Halomonas sp. MCCC 1A11057]|jgi:type III secretion protein U|uniref:type III secretion system export apparatus subunit SctU n=1 Tax=Halomonas sp. MCCC 1A11057 TaxID=2733482 RepID=UPI001F26A193|nr:type III secretion system export apparatus subunit SctU [Halomonas sp. MCCC 1A11057]MCE8032149.1 type III secretion system export apparatus subunit SctU [Halomonas sp. MCCC 1A11057]